jgi:GrpB-like predicted nucleotidyltransferase (UPF0157 family)
MCDGETSEERLAAITIGERASLDGPIHLADYDPEWPHLFARQAERIRAALGEGVRLLEHVGSTSVPGLCAKPILDIVLAVPDSAAEPAYVPALEARGFALRIREVDWFQHRLLRHVDPATNLHVFSAGCPEIERMLAFRDRLRSHDGDRDAYASAKRALAARTWRHTQHYADAKTGIVREILARAEAPA